MARRYLHGLFVVFLVTQVSAVQTPVAKTVGEAVAIDLEELRLPKELADARVHSLAIVEARLDGQGKVVSTSSISGDEPLLKVSRDNLAQWTFAVNEERRVVVAYYFKVEGLCRDNSRSVFQQVLNNLVIVTGCIGPTR